MQTRQQEDGSKVIVPESTLDQTVLAELIVNYLDSDLDDSGYWVEPETDNPTTDGCGHLNVEFLAYADKSTTTPHMVSILGQARLVIREPSVDGQITSDTSRPFELQYCINDGSWVHLSEFDQVYDQEFKAVADTNH